MSSLLVNRFRSIFFASAYTCQLFVIRFCGVKILFTSTHVTSFITEDLTLLRKYFDIDHIITRGITAPLTILKHLPGVTVTFTWFASVYSGIVIFLSKCLGRKSILVIGGVDVAKYPEMNYGIWINPWKALVVKYALRNAFKVLAVDPFQQQQAIRLAGYDGANIEYVPTGYDASRWTPDGPKHPFVLSVGACHDRARLRIKGFDILFESARHLGETRFVVIGIPSHLIHSLRGEVPPNVEIIPYVEQGQLLSYYRQAQVYCQPSYVEGLPNTLCEAMLCECIPVGTNVGGIPTAMADIGFLVPYGDVGKLTEAIRQALHAPASVGARAREHIVRNFPTKRREDALVRIVREAAG